MGRNVKIDSLKALSLEEKARQVEKEMPCSIIVIIAVVTLILGLYYWFGNSFIVDYSLVSPFWGFVLIIILGFLFLLSVGAIYRSYWKEYNDEIESANNDILEIIKNGDCSNNDIFRMKRDYIERKIGKDTLTDEEFKWHSSNFCWGCGKRHVVQPKVYVVKRERTETWKENIYRYTKTFRESEKIWIYLLAELEPPKLN